MNLIYLEVEVDCFHSGVVIGLMKPKVMWETDKSMYIFAHANLIRHTNVPPLFFGHFLKQSNL